MASKIHRSTYNYNKRALPQHILRRIKWYFGDKSPILAFLKVTRRCNLDCDHCPWHTSANDFAEELNTEEWQARISELVEQGVRVLVFEGGEPTLRRDLQDLLDHAHSLGVYTILATNGTTNMWKYNPTAFTVSIDGPKNLHDEIRGRGSFDKVKRNLVGKNRNRVMSITVISKANHGSIEEILAEFAGLVDGFLFTFLYPYNGRDNLTLSRSEIQQTKSELLELKKIYHILNPRDFLSKPMTPEECRDYISVSLNYRGEAVRGCFVEHAEERNCEGCELSCYQVLSAFHKFNLETWFSLYRLFLKAI